MAFRARDSIRTTEVAYSRLDEALRESEQARDDLARANEELARANTELGVIHTAFSDLLDLADERSRGRMRELIEETGDQLAEPLMETPNATSRTSDAALPCQTRARNVVLINIEPATRGDSRAQPEIARTARHRPSVGARSGPLRRAHRIWHTLGTLSTLTRTVSDTGPDVPCASHDRKRATYCS